MRTLLQRYVDSLLDQPLATELDQPLDAIAGPKDAKYSLWQRYWASLTGFTPPRELHESAASNGRIRSPKPGPSEHDIRPARSARNLVIGTGVLGAIVFAIWVAILGTDAGITYFNPSARTTSPAPVSGSLYPEQSNNHLGVRVFDRPDGKPSETVPPIPYGTRVKVLCVTPNATGAASISGFYLIETEPWKGFYAPTNAFTNGVAPGEPGRPTIDPDVPECPPYSGHAQ